MGGAAQEPSMEEILSSIKKIIAEDDGRAQPAPKARSRAASSDAATPSADADDAILELTEAVVVEQIVSADAAAASRQALSSLSRLIVKPDIAGADTLEGLVREMLKPMLKDWLDAHLPEIVERVVAQEVARITGQAQS
jgi:cell pole-organizing protein PopZ